MSPREGATGDRTGPLVRVQAIGFGIHCIVQQIDAGSHRTKDSEGGERSHEVQGGGQDRCGGRSYEDEQVLDPLARAHGQHDVARRAAPRGPATVK